MGYLHIENLYKDQRILEFKRCYALEKIHGTSANIAWKPFTWQPSNVPEVGERALQFSSGGEAHSRFVALFDAAALAKRFSEKFADPVTVYGEAYGGRQQGMSDTYGKDLKFVVFDVQVGDCWLAVPQAEDVASYLGLEFVPYEEIDCNIGVIDYQRDRDSVQAVRNGVEEPRKREGVVLRPMFECTLNNGARLIAKHKRDEFAERKTKQIDPLKQELLKEAEAIADEWVTAMRLEHVINRLISDRDDKDIQPQDTGDIVKLMIEDVNREASGEIVGGPNVNKAIGKAAARLFMTKLKSSLTK